MITAVDSSVLFEILKAAPKAESAATALEHAARQGSLCVCAPVVAELGRYFDRSEQLLEFFADAQIEYSEISLAASLEAARMMNTYAKKRTRKHTHIINNNNNKHTHTIQNENLQIYKVHNKS